MNDNYYYYFFFPQPASARGTGIQVIYKWCQMPKKRPLLVQKSV